MTKLPGRATLQSLLVDHTFAEVGAMYGVSRQAVHNAFGSVRRSSRWRTDMQSVIRPHGKEIHALIKSGVSGVEVARKFGVSYFSLLKFLSVRKLHPPLISRHGTVQRYSNGGCRCRKCGDANREYRQNSKRRKKGILK